MNLKNYIYNNNNNNYIANNSNNLKILFIYYNINIYYRLELQHI